MLSNLRRELENQLAKIPNWPALIEQAMRFLCGPTRRNPEVALPSPVSMNITSDGVTEDDLLALSTFPSPRGSFFINTFFSDF